MATINLREFYPWYTHDEIVDVPDVIAAELMAGRRYDYNYKQRVRRNMAFYSLDAEDGIETAVIYRDRTPWELIEMAEQHCRLCRALNSLPEIQGRRIEAHFILGKSRAEIAEAEGVSENSVNVAIKRGLLAMRKFLQKNN